MRIDLYSPSTAACVLLYAVSPDVRWRRVLRGGRGHVLLINLGAGVLGGAVLLGVPATCRADLRDGYAHVTFPVVTLT